MYLARGIRRFTDSLGMTKNIQEFRTDVGRELISADQIPHPEQSPWELNRAIVEAREAAESTIWEDIGVIGGIVPTLLVPFGIEVGWGIQIVGAFLTITLFLRAVTIGVLAFDPPDPRVRPQWHAFMLAWNRGHSRARSRRLECPWWAC